VILVTGGARSGKSGLAERLATDLAAKAGGGVLYVASAEARDDEMRRRIERHQARRPATWGTLEAPFDAVPRLREHEGRWGALLFDCLTLYLSNLMFAEAARAALGPGAEGGGFDPSQLPEALVDLEATLLARMEALAGYLRSAWPQSVVVTNEVGSGIVPGDPLSRLFQDLQGRANQAFARDADEVYLCVSGLPLRLKP
jgi:adenosylcobinamide kinase / adenosylcobinamide-phosphate guanylyltransferase